MLADIWEPPGSLRGFLHAVRSAAGGALRIDRSLFARNGTMPVVMLWSAESSTLIS
jgi:hypothetical protein